MKLIPLNRIFNIEYGNQLDFNKMTKTGEEGGGINFISRASKNFGIIGKVRKVPLIEPYDAGLITVTLGGSYLLASFIQPEIFYTAQNIKVLKPKHILTFSQKLFYCLCIQQNRFRYSSHGREANVSLDNLLIPDKIPKKFDKYSLNDIGKDLSKAFKKSNLKLNTALWKYFQLHDLFEVSASKDKLINKYTLGGGTPYITSSELNNGISSFVEEPPSNKAKTITANRGGSVGRFFYQPRDYLATPVDVRILTPKFEINQYIGLFLTTILKKERYRFNYARKMGTDRLGYLKIKLPSKNGNPDLELMEQFIKSLPYSSSL